MFAVEQVGGCCQGIVSKRREDGEGEKVRFTFNGFEHGGEADEAADHQDCPFHALEQNPFLVKVVSQRSSIS